MLAWLVGSAWATSVAEVPNPRPSGGWVSDVAHALDAGQIQSLNDELDALDRDLGAEVAVVTVPSVDGDTPKGFATALFQRWGIGKAGADNGVLVLLVLGTERDVEIEPGYGLEGLLTDAWLWDMEDRVMVPPLRAGSYGQGLLAGVQAIDRQLRDHPDEARTGGRAVPPPQVVDPRIAAGVLAPVPIVLVAVGVGQIVRRRRRTCPTCHVYMPMLDEADDDAFLTAGQVREEQVGSVDYQVHQCPKCGHTRTFPVKQWFSGYSRCSACGNRTRKTTTTVLVPATTMNSGLQRITEHCEFCGAGGSYTVAIPQIVESSSSSSSGSSGGGGGHSGGSFGGGHSGGGGAGHHF